MSPSQSPSSEGNETEPAANMKATHAADVTPLFGIEYVSQGVNLSKGLTGLVMTLSILYTRNFSYGAVVYAFMHGLYGALWVLKQVYFPDKNFIKRPSEVLSFNFGVELDFGSPAVELCVNVVLFFGVCTYWLGGLSLIFAGDMYVISPLRLGVAVAMYSFGVFLHFGADVQKYERLKYKKGLIMDGFYSICRSPGYLGEIFIYGALFMLCPFGWPLVCSASVMIFSLPTFLIGKERSISRHSEYPEYSQRVKLLIPFVF